MSVVNFWVLELRSDVNDLVKRIECGFKDHDHYGLFMEINSIYFHSKGTQRFWKNNIDDIRNSSRHWTTDSKEVADCLINYC